MTSFIKATGMNTDYEYSYQNGASNYNDIYLGNGYYIESFNDTRVTNKYSTTRTVNDVENLKDNGFMVGVMMNNRSFSNSSIYPTFVSTKIDVGYSVPNVISLAR